MKAKVAMIEVGMASVAMIVVRQSRMKSRIVRPTSTAASTRWNLHLVDRVLDELRLVADDHGLDVGRQHRRELGEPLLDRLDDLHRVGAGLLLHDQADGVSPRSVPSQPRPTAAQPRGSSNESSTRPMSLIRTG